MGQTDYGQNCRTSKEGRQNTADKTTYKVSKTNNDLI